VEKSREAFLKWEFEMTGSASASGARFNVEREIPVV
jgi:hypothetical protein